MNEQELINRMLNDHRYDDEAVRAISQDIAPIYTAEGKEMPVDEDGVYFGWTTSKALSLFKGIYDCLEDHENRLSYTENMVGWVSTFNDTQIELINQYVFNGDVPFEFLDEYVVATIPYAKLNWIFKCISGGHYDYVKDNMDKLVKLDVDQVSEIYGALNENVDIASIYDLDNLPSAEKMGLIRHCIGFNLDFAYNEEDGKLTIY